MTSNVPLPGAEVVADPRKPWKALTALLIPAILAALNAIINANIDGTLLPQWAALLVVAVATGLGVYATPNPKVLKSSLNRRNDLGYGAVELLVVVILVVVLIVVLFRVL